MKSLIKKLWRLAREPFSYASHEAAKGWDRIYYTGLGWRRSLRNGSRAGRMLFYPQLPHVRPYAIKKICAEMGIAMTQTPAPDVRLAMLWEDLTVSRAVELEVAGLRILNASCRDISKTNVARHFDRVFGYSFAIDPTAHEGPCVEKSNENGRHDGRIVECPITNPRPDAVYQRVIDNATEDAMVVDIRTPIVGGTIPFVYLKYRPLVTRFSNTNARAEMKETAHVFSTIEVQRIVEFCHSLGLDYGELDILRDRNDGKIYIVDVNTTPYGPPNHLPRSQGRRAIRILAAEFRARFLEVPSGKDHPVRSPRVSKHKKRLVRPWP